MALFTSKRDMVNTILADNIHSVIKDELQQKLMALVEEQIEQVVLDTVNDLVSRIDTYHDFDGTIKVNVQFNRKEA